MLKGLSASQGSRGAEHLLHRQREILFTEGLLDNHRIGPEQTNRSRIPADEHVRHGTGAENFVDGGNTAFIAQPRVDDHQIRAAARRAATASASFASIAQTS